jgi:hypothetical protein
MTLSFNNLTIGKEGGIFNFSNRKCVYDRTAHRRRWHVDSYRSVRCTEAGGMWTVIGPKGAPMGTSED